MWSLLILLLLITLSQIFKDHPDYQYMPMFDSYHDSVYKSVDYAWTLDLSLVQLYTICIFLV